MRRLAVVAVFVLSALAGAAGPLLLRHAAPAHAVAFTAPAIPGRAYDWADYRQFNPGQGNLAITEAGVPGVTKLVGHAQVYLIDNDGASTASAVVALSENAPPSRVLWAALVGARPTVNDVGEAEDDVHVAAAPGNGVTLQIAGLTLASGNYAILYLAGWDV